MKTGGIICILLSIACFIAGFFLLCSIDASSRYDISSYNPNGQIDRTITLNSAVKSDASDSIIEDPNVGILYLPYDYSMPAPESEAVELSHFNKSVFIGDSRMLGLIKYTDVEPINYCSVGFAVNEYDGRKFIRIDGENYTVKEALRQNDDFDSIYIATGLNELGWSLSKFTEKYKEMLTDIKAVAGERDIYIQLIMPVTNSFEKSRYLNPFNLKNSSVGKFNNKLREIAEEYKVFYLDCAEMFSLDNGTLDPKKSSDGAHLTTSAYDELLEYYKTHIVKSKVRIA